MIQLSRIATIVELPPLALPLPVTRYTLVDRGIYAYRDDVEVPEVVIACASQVTGRTLGVARSRVLQLVAGDYLLLRHDPMHADHRVEVIVDMSPAPVPRAEVRYHRRGQAFHVFPSRPGAASIVERDPTTQCHHTYISKLHPAASVVRLVVQLVDA